MQRPWSRRPGIPSRTTPARALAVRAVLAVLAVLATACRDTGSEDGAAGAAPSPPSPLEGIYRAVEPVTEGPPGEILAQEPVPVPPAVSGGTPASAWRVLYRSRSLQGEPVAVSGLVVRPDGRPPAGGWPVLSWAHGTTGSADSCAPSRAGVVSIPSLDRMLDAGYLVVATDYEGLGTPGPHPYLVGASEGRSVLDAARAARHLVPEATGPVLAWGHSQGGQAALWAGELAAPYAPELAVVGVAAFAPAARQETLLEPGQGGPNPLVAGFTVAAAAGMAAARPELRLADLLADAALARLDVLETGCIAQVLTAFATVPGGVLRPDAGELEDWRAAIDANQAGEQSSAVPVLVLQGDDDVLVRPATAERYRERACGTATVVELLRYLEADHTTIVSDGWADAERWSADRQAGLPAPGC